jgi:hypothetical protein
VDLAGSGWIWSRPTTWRVDLVDLGGSGWIWSRPTTWRVELDLEPAYYLKIRRDREYAITTNLNVFNKSILKEVSLVVRSFPRRDSGAS